MAKSGVLKLTPALLTSRVTSAQALAAAATAAGLVMSISMGTSFFGDVAISLAIFALSRVPQ